MGLVTTLWLLLAGAGPEASASSPAALDLSGLSESARHEVTEALGDEFCGCGAPHTLAACLKTHPSCRHSVREAQLAASVAEKGATASELGVVLARYNLSFREARAKLPVDERMCMGEAHSPMTLVEYADFECPICGATRPILEKFVQDRAGQVRLCYLPFPLPQHPNAIPAGQAALFARDHGKFWAVHDGLFENQKRLSPDVIREVVVQAGLSADAWAKALAKNAYVEELEQLKDTGLKAGVQGTPTIYLNGRKLDFYASAAILQITLDDERDFQSHRGMWVADDGK
jgi:protein-disulfide isomerase